MSLGHWTACILLSACLGVFAAPSEDRHVVCGSECLFHLPPPEMYFDAVIHRRFTPLAYVSACPNYNLYNACMQQVPDCVASDFPEHFIQNDILNFTCGIGYPGLIHYGSCWAKPAMVNAWTHCFVELNHTGDLCSAQLVRKGCLESEVLKYCGPEPIDVVRGFYDATARHVYDICGFNSTVYNPVTTPEPETEATPKPESEVTPEPETEATPKPESEVTPEPESEVTAEPNTTTTTAAAEDTTTQQSTSTSTESTHIPFCHLPSYTMCATGFFEYIRDWGMRVTAEAATTNTFNTSVITALCSSYTYMYKPCADPPLSGCPKDMTVIHDSLSAALDYICTAQANTLTSVLECIGEPAVLAGLMQCRDNVPQTTMDPCKLTDTYMSCIDGVTTGTCSDSARAILNDLIMNIMLPVNDLFNCEVSTTSAPPTTTTTQVPFNNTSEPSTSTPEPSTTTTNEPSTTTTTTEPSTTTEQSTTTTEPSTSTPEPSTTTTEESTTTSSTASTTSEPSTSSEASTTEPSTSTTAESTTTINDEPLAVIECYECHSGGGSWQNPHCTPEGDVVDWAVSTSRCNTCFARTNKWNKGVIVRGCADHHMPWEMRHKIPKSGCHKDIVKDETWCFCSGDDKCNNMSMIDHLP